MHFVEKKGRGDCKGSVQIFVNSSSIVKSIIIMKFCKALTPRLKAPNEQNTAMYVKLENAIRNLTTANTIMYTSTRVQA